MPDIIKSFPGYEHIPGPENKGKGKNMYRGIDLGFGGYIYAEPGMYTNVALIDAASMHPTSIIVMNKLGKYTNRYADLKRARVLIKHHDYKSLENMFDGKLKKYLTNDEDADDLSKALKYPLNGFYGLGSANFENPAKDSRDINNTVALRGALFMKTLQDEVVKKGYKVISIRTDSIKIPDATDEIIKFVQDFGLKYGYEMEHECTYEKLCLVNDAVYIAKYDDKGIRNKGGKHAGEWTATGAQFQVPYVFKTLFTHEKIEFKDMCEAKSVQTEIYIDNYTENQNYTDKDAAELLMMTKAWNSTAPTALERCAKKLGYSLEEMGERYSYLKEQEAKTHYYRYVGKVGLFCPMKTHGGKLVRESGIDKDGNKKFSSVTGTKGYLWMESENVKLLGYEDDIDISYYRKLVDEAIDSINEFGDFEQFVA